MTTPAFQLLDFISDRKGRNDKAAKSAIDGLYVTAMEDVPNDYGDYKVIHSGTVIRCDFGGDFGFYGFADVDGAIRRTRVDLKDVHRFDWSPYADKISSYA